MRAGLSVAAVVVAFSPAVGAAPTGAVCEESRVRILGTPDAHWLEPILRACEDLRVMEDSDATARIQIVPAGTDLVVLVTLKDGRSTLRRVSSPSALESTLEALLALPTPPPAAALAPAVALEPAPPPSMRGAPPLAGEPPGSATATTTTTADLPRGFGVEFGGDIAGRVAGGQGFLSLAPSGFAQLRAGQWLLGMAARWDVVTWSSGVDIDSFEMETVAAGIVAAHRFRPGFADVDVGASPRLVSETQGYETGAGEKSSTVTDIRLTAFVRTAFGRSALRAFVEVDAELSPERIRRGVRSDPALPPLPAWSGGIGVGLMWGNP